MNLLCKAIGHQLGPVIRVITNPEFGGHYFARKCQRCEMRLPETEEDAQKKGAVTAEINRERRQRGFAPWNDR